MKVLVISDVHANLTSLNAVLEDAGEFDCVWCLGDLVGYGPDPNECIDFVRSQTNVSCLIGNHDQAALGQIPLSHFNSDARRIAIWTQEALTEKNLDYLRSLPAIITNDKFTLAHGSPRKPTWEYIFESYIAKLNFKAFETDYCLVGHSHLPLAFQHRPKGNSTIPVPIKFGTTMKLSPRMILNPGSVGQPRDLDPRAAYAILDTEKNTWKPRRVEYDVTAVQVRMLQSGLPESQALRLIAGW